MTHLRNTTLTLCELIVNGVLRRRLITSSLKLWHFKINCKSVIAEFPRPTIFRAYLQHFRSSSEPVALAVSKMKVEGETHVHVLAHYTDTDTTRLHRESEQKRGILKTLLCCVVEFGWFSSASSKGCVKENMSLNQIKSLLSSRLN